MSATGTLALRTERVLTDPSTRLCWAPLTATPQNEHGGRLAGPGQDVVGTPEVGDLVDLQVDPRPRE